MGLFDELMDKVGELGRDARKEATKRAGKAALNEVMEKAESFLDETVGDAEAQLAKAQQADAGRDKLVLPDAAVDTPEWARDPDSAPEEPAGLGRHPTLGYDRDKAQALSQKKQDREARARAELAALKASLKSKDD